MLYKWEKRGCQAGSQAILLETRADPRSPACPVNSTAHLSKEGGGEGVKDAARHRLPSDRPLPPEPFGGSSAEMVSAGDLGIWGVG